MRRWIVARHHLVLSPLYGLVKPTLLFRVEAHAGVWPTSFYMPSDVIIRYFGWPRPRQGPNAWPSTFDRDAVSWEANDDRAT